MKTNTNLIPISELQFGNPLLLNNLVATTDTYKGGHYLMMPKGSSNTKIYIAPRKELYGFTPYIMFGVSFFIMKYLKNPITHSHIDIAKSAIWDELYIGGTPYPFPEAGWRKIVDVYGGILPITISGLPEGMPYNNYNVPCAVIEIEEKFANDKDLAWVPGWLEAVFQRLVWSATTVATKSRAMRMYLHALFLKTVDSDSMWKLDSRLHDFGGRGTVNEEGAGLLGLAHLINFNGSDTNDGFIYGNYYYLMSTKSLGCSVIATEHSVTTAFGVGLEPQITMLKQIVTNLNEKFPHIKVFSYVSDTWNYAEMVDKVWCNPEIIAWLRERGMSPVIRPDSGDAITNVLYALEKCSKAWGYTVNTKGYKVLNGIAVLQGDGMRMDTSKYLYEAVIKAGFSPENLVIGMGGGLLQDMGRDDMSWSMKLFSVDVEGENRLLMKNPITQLSKKAWNPADGYDEESFIIYYSNGKINPEAFNFGAIRQRARAGLV